MSKSSTRSTRSMELLFRSSVDRSGGTERFLSSTQQEGD
jgi:hypothetical protein